MNTGHIYKNKHETRCLFLWANVPLSTTIWLKKKGFNYSSQVLRKLLEAWGIMGLVALANARMTGNYILVANQHATPWRLCTISMRDTTQYIQWRVMFCNSRKRIFTHKSRQKRPWTNPTGLSRSAYCSRSVYEKVKVRTFAPLYLYIHICSSNLNSTAQQI